MEWDAIDWRACEQEVRRLRQRIFKATREQDWRKVRNLQRLMLRSRSNTLTSVRRVTQHNAGRRTAGVDEQVALTSHARAQVAVEVHQTRDSWHPLPVRRVHIPKAGSSTKLRPLGIPVIMDRCHQARVRNALEPEWEARFEPRSYGFRPGRGCHDAIGYLFCVLSKRNARRVWILDADLAAAFDKIDHSSLLSALGSFPARKMIHGWLKAGVFEAGKGFAPTDEGSPQGGVISPLLMNVALHGLEAAAGVQTRASGKTAGFSKRTTPALVRYADDFVVCCHSRQQAEQVKAQLAGWLEPRGLALNEAKTSIVHASDGFDFLGFNIRRYHGKLLIKPSKAAVKRVRERLRTRMIALRGSNGQAVIQELNPIIKGWAAYYRTVVSSKVFDDLDDYVWWLTWRWARRSHPGKPGRWLYRQYYGKFNTLRNDRWVFGHQASGRYMVKFSWTRIVRHIAVQGGASPDDPALDDYWATRRKRTTPPLDGYTLNLLTRQDGRCPLCGEPLLSADQPPQSPRDWEKWWLQVSRKAIAASYLTHHGGSGPPDTTPTSLVHDSCRRRLIASQRRNTAGRLAKPKRPA
ncbi:group II intron reverse transcriptase/maturase [Actinomadura madurae]|uniref:group II intron reverse transcriptase/maturase n=1 Tax=Actinomadura madurae TaxID=1993 RepID=UPI002026E8CA|nr:group II intron reverse transcriptase/maturase [Actinomadura madurae]URN05014.1 group II intron reverse transcriptase/maturase [Actinomadura madurae]